MEYMEKWRKLFVGRKLQKIFVLWWLVCQKALFSVLNFAILTKCECEMKNFCELFCGVLRFVYLCHLVN